MKPFKRRHNGKQNVGQKGTARWATPEELTEQYLKISEKDGVFPGRGGLPVARKDSWLYIDQEPIHTLILGTTRSGMGENYVFPTIDKCAKTKEKTYETI